MPPAPAMQRVIGAMTMRLGNVSVGVSRKLPNSEDMGRLRVAQFGQAPYRADMPSELWQPDELAGFERLVLPLPAEGDGELVATLVRRKRELAPTAPRGVVLYIHGYVDYFFQVHLADAFTQAGYDFHALDLRRYGRSLRPGNVHCQFARIDDYFLELTWAIESCTASGLPLSSLVAHSTGCLVASIYASRGARKDVIGSLVLNSPFFEFRANAVEKAALAAVIRLGATLPTVGAPVRLNRVYGQTLHQSESGEWAYDLTKKPLGGFEVTAGWIHAIAKGHAELQAGLDVNCPVLVLHSTRWRVSSSKLEEADRTADIVLNVEHMKKYAHSVGRDVEVLAFEEGKHDLTLSALPVRTRVLEAMVGFVERRTG